jgi:hypothetical protein
MENREEVPATRAVADVVMIAAIVVTVVAAVASLKRRDTEQA